MLPMGTIMTLCMFIALLFASRLPVLRNLQRLPKWCLQFVAVIVLAAGCWNVLWYASQHISERWGQAALVSGLLMIITVSYIALPARVPTFLQRARPIVQILLLACAALYATTIYRL